MSEVVTFHDLTIFPSLRNKDKETLWSRQYLGPYYHTIKSFAIL